MMYKGLLAVILCGTSYVANASTTTLSLGLEDASSFNLITREDINLQAADAQGKIVVGGNATINEYDVGVTSGWNTTVLQVNGDLNASGDQIIKGNAIVKGSYSNVSSSAWHNPIPSWVSLSNEGGVDVDALFSGFDDFSLALLSMGTSDAFDIDSTVIGLTEPLDGLNSDVLVVDISIDDLNSATGIADTTNTLSANDYVVFNVFSEANVDLGSIDLLSSIPYSQNVLFNFNQATSINFDGGNFAGTILAPNADMTFDEGLITGSVYVNSFASDAGAQLNYNGGFEGKISVPQTATQIPNPNTLALLLIALPLLLRRPNNT